MEQKGGRATVRGKASTQRGGRQEGNGAMPTADGEPGTSQVDTGGGTYYNGPVTACENVVGGDFINIIINYQYFFCQPHIICN